MKLTILQEKFREGISAVERIAAKSLTLPILNNILLKTERNLLCLSSTDLEVGIKFWTLAKVKKEGQIAIPSQLLSNFINLLPNKTIELETKDNSLSLYCGEYLTSLKGISPEEFPIIPQIAEGESLPLNNPPFCQGLTQVSDIASPSPTRPEISGIYFLFQKDLIKMAATDSFRLGEKTIFLDYNRTAARPVECSFILPHKAAREIINILGEKEGEIKISFSPNHVLFEYPMSEIPHPQIQLVSRLIEGEYPDYQEIIPKKSETQIVFLKSEFLNQLKTASLFSGKISEVKFKVNPAKEVVELFSQNPDLGEYHSSLKAKIKGKSLEISFNHRFLLDGISKIKTPEVIFELTGEGGPGVLKPVGDQSYLYVVMPIKAS